MKIYKILVKNNFSNPIFFVVDSMAEIEKLYRKECSEGSEISIVEFLGDNVVVSENIIVKGDRDGTR